MKMVRVVFIFIVLSFIFTQLDKINGNITIYAQDCDPYSCKPCTGTKKCTELGPFTYLCVEGKTEGQGCNPLNICGDCKPDLNCVRAGFGDYICLPPDADPSKYECDPWTCAPCTGINKCVRTGIGQYHCSEGKREAEACEPANICGECSYGLTCTRAGFGAYVCLPPGADPNDYGCDPYSGEPCKSNGGACVQVSLATYACQYPNQSPQTAVTEICSFVNKDPNDSKRKECNDCFKNEGVYTPFGCIQTNPQQFIEKILKIAIGIAGGIAFLMIIYGGFVTMTSSGNPERLTSGKEIITSAIAGLLLIIFSVVILRIIGVDILGIPGLAGG